MVPSLTRAAGPGVCCCRDSHACYRSLTDRPQPLRYFEDVDPGLAARLRCNIAERGAVNRYSTVMEAEGLEGR